MNLIRSLRTNGGVSREAMLLRTFFVLCIHYLGQVIATRTQCDGWQRKYSRNSESPTAISHRLYAKVRRDVWPNYRQKDVSSRAARSHSASS